MIDLQYLRQHPEIFKDACAKKRVRFDVDAFLALDSDVRAQKVKVEQLRAEQNAANKAIPTLSGDARQEMLARMRELAAQVKESSAKLAEREAEWERQQLFIPQPTLDRVPVGKDDSENVEVKRWGTPASFPFEAKDHITLGKHLDIIDFERGVKISGARSYFLKGDGARLQHALLQCAMDLLHRKGYVLFDPPHLVHYDAMMGTSYFPGGEEMAYHLDERDPGTYLIGTSEVSVCSYHQDEVLEASRLPLRYAGYSPCYRREAGSYGKDTAGLYRVHQFYKVEQVIICRADADESAALHQELLSNAEELLQMLELPYRVVDVCTGDIGLGQVFKNDIETWMPSRSAYGETHSCSTFHDFQSRRLKLRYKDETGKNMYCHTLNNTLIASPRLLIPLLEVNQQADGSVVIPKVLRSYMGGQEQISARK
jgi:seryl-tRNA synthetase